MKHEVPLETDHLVSISEFAKIKGLTTETLRHYDRVGLFKPDYIDPQTQYRYYSILRYEEIGIIKQLRELGMSIDQIKDYFVDRTVEKSYQMLQEQYRELDKKLKELSRMKRELRDKIKYIAQIRENEWTDKAYLLDLPERTIITKGVPQPSLGGFGKDMIELENCLNEQNNLANEREGAILQWDLPAIPRLNSPSIPFIVTKKREKKLGRTLEAGKYICSCYHGYYIRKDQRAIQNIEDFAKKNGYELENYIVASVLIGPTITEFTEELMIELQVKIK